MKKYNFGISVLLIALSIWLIKTSAGYGNAVNGTAMGAGQWPTILAVLLLILSGVLIIQTVIDVFKDRKNKHKSEENVEKTKKVIDFNSKGMIRVYIIIGILAAFYVVTKYLGFWIGAALAIPGVLFVMGEKKWWKILALTAGILLFVFLVFDLALGLTLPIGLVFK